MLIYNHVSADIKGHLIMSKSVKVNKICQLINCCYHNQIIPGRTIATSDILSSISFNKILNDVNKILQVISLLLIFPNKFIIVF